MIDDITLGEVFAQDPEGLYRKLRTEAPVCRVKLVNGVQAWLVTRYADAVALLNDPRVIKDQSRALANFRPDRVRPYQAAITRNMLGLDPPEHTRLRRLVVQAFTSRAVERLQSEIVAIADELLDDIDRQNGDEPVELMAAFAEPLPIRVISRLLGVPADSGHAFRIAVGPLIRTATNDEKAVAEGQIVEILNDLIDRKHREPGGDLLTSLISASVDGNRLSHDELVAMCFLLITAGYETTVNLIGNGTLTLLENPSQLEAVRQNPTLIANTVEETLRFDGPVNIATLRFSTAEVPVGQVVIPPHEIVLIALLSANRDNERFPDPDRFDVTRNTRGHLGFGYGIHHCLGASLARMEGVTAIGRLLARYDDIVLDRSKPLQYYNSTLMHGLTALPVWLRKSGGCTARPADRSR